MTDFKALITQVVNNHQGIKAVELVVEVMQQSAEMDLSMYEDALVDCIKDGEIVEVEYTIPAMDYRVKSLYLPKGSVVQATGQGY